MAHVLVAGKLHPSGLALLEQAGGITFDHVEEISEASYQPFLEQADAIVIRTQPLSAASIGRAHRLKVVSRHGVGYDAVDVAAVAGATRQGHVVHVAFPVRFTQRTGTAFTARGGAPA